MKRLFPPFAPKSAMSALGGFMLFELLATTALFSLLASITFSTYREVRAQANDVRRLEDAKTIILALELYRRDHGHYPCDGYQNSLSSSFLSPLVSGGYLATIPKDPKNTESYIYHYAPYRQTVSGQCGQIFEFNYNIERRGTPCIHGGKLIPSSNPNASHCHIFIPTPLPSPPCPDQWADSGTCNALIGP